jgi:hypothetical protein
MSAVELLPDRSDRVRDLLEPQRHLLQWVNVAGSEFAERTYETPMIIRFHSGKAVRVKEM